ncbi:MAG TPA: 2Fe-2S iron-sulfur cluster-binding protein, partial [Dongiaceae bacterium]|nr:2Fe-2S iron-sulfur cluster-binding protein [Dongiaceae bacterium]
MSGINRLPAPAGSLIDRERTVSFQFEGRRYAGCAGDTIASALAANDVWILSRSFKYHRPRGVVTMAGLDANTLVQIGDEPNVLADRRPISEGLVVRGQNYRGSLEHDRERWIELFGKFLPVGFYYKAFYKPRGSWKLWEPFIRRRAGLGTVNTHAHHGHYDKAYLFADVAVVGAGPAGLAAALEAAKSGAEVILIDDGAAPGGSLGYARFDADGSRGARLAEELAEAVRAEPNIRLLADAVCTGLFADNWLAVIRGNRLYKLRAKASVIATGSLEQPAIFRNNDLPGIMLGSAAQRLIRLYGVKPGRKAVVLTANADGYGVALDLADAGVAVQAVVDLRDEVTPASRTAAVQNRDIRIITGSAIPEALPGPGKHRVAGVLVARR